MAFHLQTNENLNRGMRRILCEQIDAALKISSARSRVSTSRRVHSARKHIKKIRTIFRLLREEIGPARFKAENRRLREAGRQLSPMRDAEVRVRTLDKLCALFFDRRNEFPQVRRSLTRESRESAAEAAVNIKKLRGILLRVRREGRALKLSSFGSGQLRKALRHVYKQARGAFHAAQQDSGQNRLHELRKRLKDLWYELRIIRRVFPEVLSEQARQAKLLTQYLGDNLDLAVMREALTDRKWKPAAAAECEALFAIIDARRPRLCRAALDLCVPFFSEGAAAFAHRLTGYSQEQR